MTFDPHNHINKLCVQGMQLEGEGQPQQAADIFMQAWDQATTTLEKFTAAHYAARHQPTVADKLKWDETALALALQLDDPGIKQSYSSLYLNIAKGYEDLNKLDQAADNYKLALHYSSFLPPDGYGKMILAGIAKGIERLENLA